MRLPAAAAFVALLAGRATAAPQAQDPSVRAHELATLCARPAPLDSVRLLGGPLKQAQDRTAAYLLALEPDRMLAHYRKRAGLEPKAEPYGGWDGGGRNLTGHIAGHYLSAVSLMYQATGDERFLARANQLVAELKAVQDAHGDGYLSALEGGRECFAAVARGEIRSSGFDLNGQWSPWYTLHKTFAGLRDAYRHAGNATALAVQVAFAAWAERVLAPLSDAQLQRMLETEFGGMNEVLADLYADTGDRRWLALSMRFEHRAFTVPLQRHQDPLDGRHGNTAVPKLVGSAARFGYTGEAGDLLAAAFFWDRVVQHHSYATGGHGLDEYFGPPDKLARRVDGRTAETCNVYNMLKLTRRLFALRPDAHYADFHERALFNHVLASIDPEDGRTAYMVPVGRGVQQEYADMTRSFTCCVGTGMESHALHGDGIYYESDDTVWVNLFVPSTVELPGLGVALKMDTGFPEGDTATITVTPKAAQAFTLALRRPGWAGQGFAVRVNGEAVALAEEPRAHESDGERRADAAGARAATTPLPASSFVALARTWQPGDRAEVALPKSLRLEPTPDDPRVTAILWGPLVLAGDLGPRRGRRGRDARPPAPVLVAADRPLGDWLVPAEAQPGDFVARGVARRPAQPDEPGDVNLVPFYRMHRRSYAVYFDLLTPQEWTVHAAELAAAAERRRKLEAATVAFVQPGEMQPERDAGYQSEPAERRPVRSGARRGRGGPGWFSFTLPVDPVAPMALVVTYENPNARGAAFAILVDGTQVARFSPAAAEGFHDVDYPLPDDLVRGKERVTIRFQADPGARIANVFGLRTVRR